MGDLVTLEFGHFSSFVSTHYHNVEDYLTPLITGDASSSDPPLEQELSRTSLFRQSDNGVAKPRRLAVGLSGSLGTMFQSGDLHSSLADPFGEEINSWGGKLTRIAQEMEVAPKDSESPQFWTDFCRHKRSLDHKNSFTLPGLFYGVHAFDGFKEGAQFVEDFPDIVESIGDKVRTLVEECDTLQGFQVLIDSDSAFSGFATRFLSSVIRQDYSAPLLVYGVTPFSNASVPLEQQRMKLRRELNEALMIHELQSISTTVYMPVSAQHLAASRGWLGSPFFPSLPGIDYSNPFHSSALLASALSSLSSTYRRATPLVDLRGMMHALCPLPNLRLLSCNMALPLDPKHKLLKSPPKRFHKPKENTGEESSSTKPTQTDRTGIQWSESISPLSPLYLSMPRKVSSEREVQLSEWSVLRGAPEDSTMEEDYTENVMIHAGFPQCKARYVSATRTPFPLHSAEVFPSRLLLTAEEYRLKKQQQQQQQQQHQLQQEKQQHHFDDRYGDFNDDVRAFEKQQRQKHVDVNNPRKNKQQEEEEAKPTCMTVVAAWSSSSFAYPLRALSTAVIDAQKRDATIISGDHAREVVNSLSGIAQDYQDL